MKILKYLTAYFIARILGTVPYFTSSKLQSFGLDSVLCGYIFIVMTVFILFTIFFMTVSIMIQE